MKRKTVSVEVLRKNKDEAIGTLYKVLIVGQQQGTIQQSEAARINGLLTALDLAFQPVFRSVVRRESTAVLHLFTEE